jgi:hypothetical protein
MQNNKYFLQTPPNKKVLVYSIYLLLCIVKLKHIYFLNKSSRKENTYGLHSSFFPSSPFLTLKVEGNYIQSAFGGESEC